MQTTEFANRQANILEQMKMLFTQVLDQNPVLRQLHQIQQVQVCLDTGNVPQFVQFFGQLGQVIPSGIYGPAYQQLSQLVAIASGYPAGPMNPAFFGRQAMVNTVELLQSHAGKYSCPKEIPAASLQQVLLEVGRPFFVSSNQNGGSYIGMMANTRHDEIVTRLGQVTLGLTGPAIETLCGLVNLYSLTVQQQPAEVNPVMTEATRKAEEFLIAHGVTGPAYGAVDRAELAMSRKAVLAVNTRNERWTFETNNPLHLSRLRDMAKHFRLESIDGHPLEDGCELSVRDVYSGRHRLGFSMLPEDLVFFSDMPMTFTFVSTDNNL